MVLILDVLVDLNCLEMVLFPKRKARAFSGQDLFTHMQTNNTKHVFPCSVP